LHYRGDGDAMPSIGWSDYEDGTPTFLTSADALHRRQIRRGRCAADPVGALRMHDYFGSGSPLG